MEPTLPRPRGGFATRAVHGVRAAPSLEQRALAPAIWPVSTWEAGRSQELAQLLADEREGYVYGRYDNPTNTALHTVVASLHGAEAAWATASGTAAIHAAIEAVRGAGRVLATSRLYGGTWALLDRLAATAGWQVDVADLTAPGELEAALTPDHSVVYAETIANPSTAVADVAHLAQVCRDGGAALVVDNTFASPYLCRPVELGATVVLESATKHLGGHADVVGGVVAASRAVIQRVRLATYELGASLGPFEAWLIARGIQTLALRVQRSCDNALVVAGELAAVLGADRVRYPGLASHPQHDLATSLLDGRGFGATLAFDAGARAAAESFADACEVLVRAVSLGGTHSLVLHPASTTHRQLGDGELAAAGLTPGLVRLSIGIEDADDLVGDVRAALGRAALAECRSIERRPP